MSHDTKYLRVSGRLYPDNYFFLRPCYLSENPRDAVSAEDSALQVELHGKNGILLRWGLRHVASDFGAKSDGPSFVAMRGKVPFHPDTREILFRRNGVVLHKIEVPKRGPVFQQRVHVKKTKKTYRIQWKAAHPDRLALHYHVRTSTDHGRTWIRLASRLDRAGVSVPLDALCGGEGCRVEVVAYDGINTVASRTSVPEAQPARLAVEILSPQPAEKPLDPPIELHSWGVSGGHAPASQDAECSWTADGQEIASGPDGVWYDPPPGEHEIAFHARVGKLEATSSVHVRVRKR